MKALLVVDVQNDFCAGGPLEVPGAWDTVPFINRLAADYDGVVVLTQDWHPFGHLSFGTSWGKPNFTEHDMPYGKQVMWPDHCIQGTRGAELHPGLLVPRAELIFRKGCDPKVDSYSAFEDAAGRQTGLGHYLSARGVNEVDVVGLATDFCVCYTALHARARGHQVRVLKRGCAAINRDHSLAKAVEAMHKAGVKIE